MRPVLNMALLRPTAFGTSSGPTPRSLGDAPLVLVTNDDGVRAPQRTPRLAQESARQNVSVPEWLVRVDQDEVEVALDAAVLEAVVEHEYIGIDIARIYVPISTDNYVRICRLFNQ